MENVGTVSKAQASRDAAARLDPGAWALPGAIALGACLALILCYYETFRSIVAIWSRSGTYAHGFFILPISAYIVWDERDRLSGLTPRPSYWAVGLLPLLGFGWLASRLAGVLVLEQYCAVAMLPVALWAVLGTAVARAFAFPFGFLLLGVPVGEALIPPLIDYTASFTVGALRLTGVPVLREGNFLTLPTGQWSVVEACSGLRYLIASVTLGFLYAHLMYRTWTRWAACMAASVVVPLVANWMRAYMIVMIGHLSNMRLAVGIDHLIYGWLFFGLVVLIFTWIGSFFREPELESDGAETPVAPAPPARLAGLVPVLVAVILVAGLWPVWAAGIERAASSEATRVGSLLPDVAGPFVAIDVPVGFRPHYVRASAVESTWYRRGEDRVALMAACYARQEQGAELVSSSNRLIRDIDSGWRQLERRDLDLDLGSAGVPARVREAWVDGPAGRRLVWSWYWVDGATTTSPYGVKLRELAGKLSGRPPLSCGVHAFAAGAPDGPTRALLEDFITGAMPAVEASLRGAMVENAP